jgi:hypothetical protein
MAVKLVEYSERGTNLRGSMVPAPNVSKKIAETSITVGGNAVKLQSNTVLFSLHSDETAYYDIAVTAAPTTSSEYLSADAKEYFECDRECGLEIKTLAK